MKMKIVVENWFLLVALICFIGVVGFNIVDFFGWSKEKKVTKLKEWLLFAVIQAEKTFGHDTGKLKLRYVYDLFISRFGFLAYFISFEKFSDLVDEVLQEMENVLDTNTAIKNIVEGGDDNDKK